MRGTVKYAKFAAGLYYCEVVSAREATNARGEEIIAVTYEVMDGPRAGTTFPERLSFVSQKFLKALDEPHELNAEWDTNRWAGKCLWVEVKYTPPPEEWPRYSHYKDDPRQNDLPKFEPKKKPEPAEKFFKRTEPESRAKVFDDIPAGAEAPDDDIF